MTTCRAIIKRAMRWSANLDVDRDPEAPEAANALEALQSLYMDLIGKGAQLTNRLVTADYTTGENIRVAYSGATTAAITLPTTVENKNRENFVDDAAVDNDNRAPSDFSVAVVAGTTPQTYVYDANIGDWVAIAGLTLDSEAPWSTFLSQGLSALLAVILADEEGVPIPAACGSLAGEARIRIIAKLQSSGDDDGSVFFQPDRTRQLGWG